MEKQAEKITVKGVQIAVSGDDYVSLTDIAKQSNTKAADLIKSWMKKPDTLEFFEAWEELHNPDFKVEHMLYFKMKAIKNRYIVTPKNYVKETGAIGIYSKAGRYGGGTFAHKDIALEFCGWLSPTFKVYMIKEFQRLKEEEFERKSLEWHIEMITDRIDDIRNLLDTVPGQKKARNRLSAGRKELGEEE